MKLTIDQLRKVKGIGEKTIERIIEQYAEPSVYDTSYKPYEAHELDYRDENNWLMYGDCLERMREIPDGSVDMIMADVPYQTTSCHWDSMIPLEPMWALIKRVVKSNAAIVMTASQPFTSVLGSSNIAWLKYHWTWRKTRATGHLNAKKMPMNNIEEVLVFYQNQCTYTPQMESGEPYTIDCKTKGTELYGKQAPVLFENKGTRYPTRVIEIKSKSNLYNKPVHPTQKPVSLIEYLIRTYTNESETVLDFTFGSGTTGVACRNLNRKFIGIELDENYYKLGRDRILNGDK